MNDKTTLIYLIFIIIIIFVLYLFLKKPSCSEQYKKVKKLPKYIGVEIAAKKIKENWEFADSGMNPMNWHPIDAISEVVAKAFGPTIRETIHGVADGAAPTREGQQVIHNYAENQFSDEQLARALSKSISEIPANLLRPVEDAICSVAEEVAVVTQVGGALTSVGGCYLAGFTLGQAISALATATGNPEFIPVGEAIGLQIGKVCAVTTAAGKIWGYPEAVGDLQAKVCHRMPGSGGGSVKNWTNNSLIARARLFSPYDPDMKTLMPDKLRDYLCENSHMFCDLSVPAETIQSSHMCLGMGGMVASLITAGGGATPIAALAGLSIAEALAGMCIAAHGAMGFYNRDTCTGDMQVAYCTSKGPCEDNNDELNKLLIHEGLGFSGNYEQARGCFYIKDEETEVNKAYWGKNEAPTPYGSTDEDCKICQIKAADGSIIENENDCRLAAETAGYEVSVKTCETLIAEYGMDVACGSEEINKLCKSTCGTCEASDWDWVYNRNGGIDKREHSQYDKNNHSKPEDHPELQYTENTPAFQAAMNVADTFADLATSGHAIYEFKQSGLPWNKSNKDTEAGNSSKTSSDRDIRVSSLEDEIESLEAPVVTCEPFIHTTAIQCDRMRPAMSERNEALEQTGLPTLLEEREANKAEFERILSSHVSHMQDAEQDWMSRPYTVEFSEDTVKITFTGVDEESHVGIGGVGVRVETRPQTEINMTRSELGALWDDLASRAGVDDVLTFDTGIPIGVDISPVEARMREPDDILAQRHREGMARELHLTQVMSENGLFLDAETRLPTPVSAHSVQPLDAARMEQSGQRLISNEDITLAHMLMAIDEGSEQSDFNSYLIEVMGMDPAAIANDHPRLFAGQGLEVTGAAGVPALAPGSNTSHALDADGLWIPAGWFYDPRVEGKLVPPGWSVERHPIFPEKVVAVHPQWPREHGNPSNLLQVSEGAMIPPTWEHDLNVYMQNPQGNEHLVAWLDNPQDLHESTHSSSFSNEIQGVHGPNTTTDDFPEIDREELLPRYNLPDPRVVDHNLDTINDFQTPPADQADHVMSSIGRNSNSRGAMLAEQEADREIQRARARAVEQAAARPLTDVEKRNKYSELGIGEKFHERSAAKIEFNHALNEFVESQPTGLSAIGAGLGIVETPEVPEDLLNKYNKLLLAEHQLETALHQHGQNFDLSLGIPVVQPVATTGPSGTPDFVSDSQRPRTTRVHPTGTQPMQHVFTSESFLELHNEMVSNGRSLTFDEMTAITGSPTHFATPNPINTDESALLRAQYEMQLRQYERGQVGDSTAYSWDDFHDIQAQIAAEGGTGTSTLVDLDPRRRDPRSAMDIVAQEAALAGDDWEGADFLSVRDGTHANVQLSDHLTAEEQFFRYGMEDVIATEDFAGHHGAQVDLTVRAGDVLEVLPYEPGERIEGMTRVRIVGDTAVGYVPTEILSTEQRPLHFHPRGWQPTNVLDSEGNRLWLGEGWEMSQIKGSGTTTKYPVPPGWPKDCKTGESLKATVPPPIDWLEQVQKAQASNDISELENWLENANLVFPATHPETSPALKGSRMNWFTSDELAATSGGQVPPYLSSRVERSVLGGVLANPDEIFAEAAQWEVNVIGDGSGGETRYGTVPGALYSNETTGQVTSQRPEILDLAEEVRISNAQTMNDELVGVHFGEHIPELTAHWEELDAEVVRQPPPSIYGGAAEPRPFNLTDEVSGTGYNPVPLPDGIDAEPPQIPISREEVDHARRHELDRNFQNMKKTKQELNLRTQFEEALDSDDRERILDLSLRHKELIDSNPQLGLSHLDMYNPDIPIDDLGEDVEKAIRIHHQRNNPVSSDFLSDTNIRIVLSDEEWITTANPIQLRLKERNDALLSNWQSTLEDADRTGDYTHVNYALQMNQTIRSEDGMDFQPALNVLDLNVRDSQLSESELAIRRSIRGDYVLDGPAMVWDTELNRYVQRRPTTNLSDVTQGGTLIVDNSWLDHAAMVAHKNSLNHGSTELNFDIYTEPPELQPRAVVNPVVATRQSLTDEELEDVVARALSAETRGEYSDVPVGDSRGVTGTTGHAALVELSDMDAGWDELLGSSGEPNSPRTSLAIILDEHSPLLEPGDINSLYEQAESTGEWGGFEISDPVRTEGRMMDETDVEGTRWVMTPGTREERDQRNLEAVDNWNRIMGFEYSKDADGEVRFEGVTSTRVYTPGVTLEDERNAMMRGAISGATSEMIRDDEIAEIVRIRQELGLGIDPAVEHMTSEDISEYLFDEREAALRVRADIAAGNGNWPVVAALNQEKTVAEVNLINTEAQLAQELEQAEAAYATGVRVGDEVDQDLQTRYLVWQAQNSSEEDQARIESIAETRARYQFEAEQLEARRLQAQQQAVFDEHMRNAESIRSQNEYKMRWYEDWENETPRIRRGIALVDQENIFSPDYVAGWAEMDLDRQTQLLETIIDP